MSLSFFSVLSNHRFLEEQKFSRPSIFLGTFHTQPQTSILNYCPEDAVWCDKGKIMVKYPWPTNWISHSKNKPNFFIDPFIWEIVEVEIGLFPCPSLCQNRPFLFLCPDVIGAKPKIWYVTHQSGPRCKVVSTCWRVFGPEKSLLVDPALKMSWTVDVTHVNVLKSWKDSSFIGCHKKVGKDIPIFYFFFFIC